MYRVDYQIILDGEWRTSCHYCETEGEAESLKIRLEGSRKAVVLGIHKVTE